MLVPIIAIKIGVSTIFSCTGAFGIVPSSQATLKASTYILLPKDEGIRGSGRVTDWQKFRAPNVLFLLKDRQILSSGTRSDKL
jgi:hypothetical protein